LLDRAKRVFDRFPAAVENTGALGDPGLHPIQHGFVLQPGDGAEPAARALRTDLAIIAC
jgi:hypothetical protein